MNQTIMYTRDSDFKCIKCGDQKGLIIITILVLFFSMCFEGYYIYCCYWFNRIIHEQKEESINFINKYVFLNVLTFYFQILSIVLTIDETLPYYINYIFSFIGNPTRVLLYYKKCLFIDLNYENYVYMELAFISSVLILKLAFIFCGLLLQKYFFHVEINRNIIVGILISFCYYEQIGVVESVFSFFPCEKILKNYYLVKDYNFKCYQDGYFFFVGIFSPILLTIWLLIYPIGFFFLLHKYKKFEFEEITPPISNVGCYYYIYERKYYYWDVIMNFYKILLVFVSDFLLFDVKTKALSLILVIFIFFIIIMRVRPFKEEFKKMNNLMDSAQILFLSLIFFSLYARGNEFDILMWISEIIIVIINISVTIISIMSAWFLFKTNIFAALRFLFLFSFESLFFL